MVSKEILTSLLQEYKRLHVSAARNSAEWMAYEWIVNQIVLEQGGMAEFGEDLQQRLAGIIASNTRLRDTSLSEKDQKNWQTRLTIFFTFQGKLQ